MRSSRRAFLKQTAASAVAAPFILSPGVSWRRLGIPKLEELIGNGVFYGAAGSEARAMQDKHVCIVGAGNSAGQSASHLAKYAASVTGLARGDSLATSMSEYLITELERMANVTIRTSVEVIDGEGDERLEAITIRDRNSGLCERLQTSGLFVLIGADPHTEWLDGAVERDPQGYILTGTDLMRDGGLPANWPFSRPPFHLETSLPGVFAAGDVMDHVYRQAVTSAGSGCMAALDAEKYLDARELQQ